MLFALFLRDGLGRESSPANVFLSLLDLLRPLGFMVMGEREKLSGTGLLGGREKLCSPEGLKPPKSASKFWKKMNNLLKQRSKVKSKHGLRHGVMHGLSHAPARVFGLLRPRGLR